MSLPVTDFLLEISPEDDERLSEPKPVPAPQVECKCMLASVGRCPTQIQ